MNAPPLDLATELTLARSEIVVLRELLSKCGWLLDAEGYQTLASVIDETLRGER